MFDSSSAVSEHVMKMCDNHKPISAFPDLDIRRLSFMSDDHISTFENLSPGTSAIIQCTMVASANCCCKYRISNVIICICVCFKDSIS